MMDINKLMGNVYKEIYKVKKIRVADNLKEIDVWSVLSDSISMRTKYVGKWTICVGHGVMKMEIANLVMVDICWMKEDVW